MTEPMGLRERKKRETGLRIFRIAIGLFAERGFDKVSVAEIAEAADVSKMTVFNYFGTKEDLVFKPLEEHIPDLAHAVRDRAPGESAVAAVRRQFLEALEAAEPSVAINPDPLILSVRKVVMETPALLIRMHAWGAQATELLAAELIAEAGATGSDAALVRCAAMQLAAARMSLVDEIHRRRLAGDPVDDIRRDVEALADRVFTLVEDGLRGYAVREGTRPAA
jgi:AcrR family transcriptional regulator